jgi:hypothetical protein
MLLGIVRYSFRVTSVVRKRYLASKEEKEEYQMEKN